ncbi:unnamed protein product [Spirodela intermedia]|uniref:Uncharacterized protein n=1 Tax=Spirodela intermedia TaxID=51605 RepID=A0A7I8KU65_SPIIN|nr:unnamed protein product [Spirodela intermedia]
MAMRGRGRGSRGRGFGSQFEHRFAKHEPYVLFPEIGNLPNISYVTSVQKDYYRLINYKLKLENFWKGSCYHLEESGKKLKNPQGADIERYSDRGKQKNQMKREALESYLKLLPSNFPTELIQGSKRIQRDKKKLRWDGDSDEKLFEKLERLEENNQKGEKEKKGDSDEEEEEQLEEVDEESSEEDDYNQNIDFDDDEDDLNMEEEEYEDAYE